MLDKHERSPLLHQPSRSRFCPQVHPCRPVPVLQHRHSTYLVLSFVTTSNYSVWDTSWESKTIKRVSSVFLQALMPGLENEICSRLTVRTCALLLPRTSSNSPEICPTHPQSSSCAIPGEPQLRTGGDWPTWGVLSSLIATAWTTPIFPILLVSTHVTCSGVPFPSAFFCLAELKVGI